ncbi:3'-5' exoribonuclease domain-containing protein [Afipia sp. DC4300-2b1]|uniref:3'-5' exoribonuclease domain-containing protein n=1 Tax=Afipia sp. DC4300-2b1 TaxID=2804672 RepID=UPI003CEF5771
MNEADRFQNIKFTDCNRWGLKMKFWFDTEFLEDGKTIELISIGVVAEDGRTYYAETPDAYSLCAESAWLKANVLSHLTGMSQPSITRPRVQIAREIIEFVGEKPEFWAYYCSYDWVALCQLYGRMIDLPKGWPMFCRDVKQLCVDLGNPKLPEQEGQEHNALADALWTKQAWEFLKEHSVAELPEV